MNRRILFVDDEPNVLQSLRRMLRSQPFAWETEFVDCAARAWDALLAARVDVVVTDVQMPGVDGLALLQRIRQNERTSDIPVVIVSGLAEAGLKARALDLGATDLLSKPIAVEDLLARLRSALRIKEFQEQQRRQTELLECAVRERTAQLAASQLEIIWRLGKAAEIRDEETGNHVIRVGHSSRTVAYTLGLDAEFSQQLFLASPLHDIGKLGIPDSILLKRGRLSDEERCLMQQHCEIGAAILSNCTSRPDHAANSRIPGFSECVSFDSHTTNPLLKMAATIALCHHERWDGKGYPRKLAGESIPIEARIVAICDVFDALRSARPYKPAFSEERALDIVRSEFGLHFDPVVGEAFETSLDELRGFHEEFCDAAERRDGEESATLGESSARSEAALAY